MSDLSFVSLIERVRAGDQDAASLLVELYAPAVRRAIRFRLTDPRMRTLFDSMDVFQSAMASFFVRAAAGQFEMDSPKQLVNLLTTMARNKLASLARKERSGFSVRSSIYTGQDDLSTAVSSEPDPALVTSARELCQNALSRMTPGERELLELRSQGNAWADIAQGRQTTPVALRKQLSRALDRVLQEAGLE